uniref:DDE Tnp4 domain-containing protein n=1 Tax=Caenorhabditis japonica TaxID=281687 RepID=A0A8R1IKJ7_CAEJA
MPATRNELESLEQKFFNLTDMNGAQRRIPCFALLDGKHFAVEHPPQSGSLNANYKGFFSFNSLMLCDSDLLVMYCQISELGDNSNAQLFRDGSLQSILDDLVRMAGFRMHGVMATAFFFQTTFFGAGTRAALSSPPSRLFFRSSSPSRLFSKCLHWHSAQNFCRRMRRVRRARVIIGARLHQVTRHYSVRMLPDHRTLIPPFLLADNGFALTHSTMQPYRQNSLTLENYEFNKMISAVRVRVENLFGVLTSKFRILRRDMNLDPSTSRALVVALCVIHNIQVGPLQLLDVDSTAPMMANPYDSPEDQRTALKRFLLDQ